MNSALKMVGGSITIYVAMAACSANVGVATGTWGTGAPKPDAGTSSGGSSITNPVATANADTMQSGSRLKTIYNVGSDGSKVFASLHDSQLNVDCTYEFASDGTTRCQPGGATVGLFFSDSACSQPLGDGASACNSQPPYAIQPVAGCPYAYRVFPVTGPFSGPVYEGTGNACIAFPAADTSSYAFYTLGAEIPPSQFVQATLQAD